MSAMNFKSDLPVPDDAPDALRVLVRRLGAAGVELDRWTLEHGENVRSMSKGQVEQYSDIIKSKADARAAVKAFWDEWHGRSTPLPREWN